MAATTPVDLVLLFRISTASRIDAQASESSYKQILAELRAGGLEAVGKTGSSPSELLIFIRCPWEKMYELAEEARRQDFVQGVSAASLPALEGPPSEAPLTPADRLRLLYSYITSAKVDGGLGIAPGAPQWPRLTGILALKDRKFEEAWVRDWTTRVLGIWMGDSELSRIKDEYGEAIALYFAFLSSYTNSLILPSLLGLVFWLFNIPYSPWYSVPLMLWSITFIELFRLRERTLAVRWGTRNATRVERRRAEFRGTITEDGTESFPWYQRELRTLAAVPVIFGEAIFLGGILTAIFVFEAFVTQIYTGPGASYAGYVPTVIFLTFIPQLLALYQASARRLTGWENHAHESSYARSLTLKTFALSATVAYLGLYLTAFVYVPFGADVMRLVYTRVLSIRLPPPTQPTSAYEALASVAAVQNGTAAPNSTTTTAAQGVKVSHAFTTLSDAESKIRPDRLHNQMFAYTVTNQVINFALEIVLPYVTRAAGNVQQGKGLSGKKGIVSEAEQAALNAPEVAILARAREEAALADYELFGDYAEMVTQFGYVVLWSVCWPLAPLMALLNNWIELRSDAFKIVTHVRRPIPLRTESIGPWLDTLSFLCWLGAVTNSALIFLFRPSASQPDPTGAAPRTLGSSFLVTMVDRARLPSSTSTLLTAVFPAILVALCASHGYILARAAVRHVLERALWHGSAAAAGERRRDRAVRSLWAKRAVASAGGANVGGVGRQLGAAVPESQGAGWGRFWQQDEGLAELRRGIKTA